MRYEEITHNTAQRDKEVENMKEKVRDRGDKVRDSNSSIQHSKREETEKEMEKIFEDYLHKLMKDNEYSDSVSKINLKQNKE